MTCAHGCGGPAGRSYWASEYDWRPTEERLNRFPQYRTEIDGLGIHFLHVRSPRPDALPLILTHGWPGSFVEFSKVIAPLSEEFHLVIPSLPGYGFSDKPSSPGWGIERIAAAWASLMAAWDTRVTAPRAATGGRRSRRRWPSRTPLIWWAFT